MPLLLDDRYTLDIVVFADARRALGIELALFVAGADILENLDHVVHVAEFALAGLHQHADRRAGLDGIDAEVVGDIVDDRHVVRIGESAVAAHEPEGFVLHRRHHLVAVLVGIDVRALDHAAGHAGMGRFTAPRQIDLADMRAAERHGALVRADQFAGREVAGRQAAHLVGEVADHGRAVVPEVLDRRVRVELLAVLANGAHQLLAVMEGRHLERIDDDRLDPVSSP